VPGAASFESAAGPDNDSSFLEIDPLGNRKHSETAPVLEPGFAGGLASLIEPTAIDEDLEIGSRDRLTEDASLPNLADSCFDTGLDQDEHPYGYSEDSLWQQSLDEIAPCISFKDDIKELPWMLWNDGRSIVTWQNAVVLGAAAGGAVIIRDDLDQKVRYETAEHTLRWGQGSVVLRQFGEYAYQVPVLAGVYAVSLWTEADHLHEFSKAVLSAYGLTAFSTVAIKGVTNTSRPTTQFENGHYGFPSYHAASAFTIAAVVEEYYGWQVGLPVYVLAGLVGWSRIDQREHDLSDVLFGSVLGFVIGKSVACAHLERRANLKITPYYDTQNRAAAVLLEKRF
jgi:membrane-associated phospholipid phosphatase